MNELHRLIDEKQWTLILRELDHSLSRTLNSEEMDSVIWAFESIDKFFREKNAQKYYFEMWKIAFNSGKIKLAKNYAEFILDYLIEYKRVPAIKKLIAELTVAGLVKKSIKFKSANAILGMNDDYSLEYSSLFDSHPEMLKKFKQPLRNFLLEGDWCINHWRLAYEYIIKFHYDKEIFYLLAEKAREKKKVNHEKNFLKYLVSKKVDIKEFDKKKKSKPRVQESELNMDYDQLAMDLISGSIEPSIAEQKRILISINNLSDLEIVEKSKDMIIAFGLLGMDKVVMELCARAIPLMPDVKSRTSILFMKAQAMFNSSDYYKVVDLVDDMFENEPLLPDEMNDFDYLKAESLLKLKKYKNAEVIFMKIKKYNPQYRLVGVRLKYLEEIK